MAPGGEEKRARPCYKLSVELLSTYKRINELFYENKRKKSNSQDPKKPLYNNGYDDESGNYIVQTGEEIAGRYIVQDLLGKGSFGVVIKAHDHRREEQVAIKIIKNKIQFYHQAQVEMDILNKLKPHAEEHNIVSLKKVFQWQEHLCLVFELLSFNLYDLLKYTKFNGVSLNLIRKFATQILKTLDFLSSPQMGIIHCDLKPENILLKNHKRSAIKVIDFGSSCFVQKRMFKYIQSRFYRSPEVILGLHYDCAIDMWSLGCILVEMHTGQALFDGRDEAEQMCKMAAVLGLPNQPLIDSSPKKKNFFQWDGKNKKWLLAPPSKDPTKYAKSTIEDILGVKSGGPSGRRKNTAGHSEADYGLFSDLVCKMLNYTAKDRLTPRDALHHPFLALAEDAKLKTCIGLPSPSSRTAPPAQPTSPISKQASESDGVTHYTKEAGGGGPSAGAHHHYSTLTPRSHSSQRGRRLSTSSHHSAAGGAGVTGSSSVGGTANVSTVPGSANGGGGTTGHHTSRSATSVRHNPQYGQTTVPATGKHSLSPERSYRALSLSPERTAYNRPLSMSPERGGYTGLVHPSHHAEQ